jgi:hypothetical protein
LRRIPLSHRSHVTGISALPTGIVQRESALEREDKVLGRGAPAASIGDMRAGTSDVRE